MIRHFFCYALLLASLCAQATGIGDANPARVNTQDLLVGTGPAVRADAFTIVQYHAWLYDPAQPEGKGREFDSSYRLGHSLTFVYGYGRALRGLERGMEGMRAGGRRLIYVPAQLGYDDLKYPTPREVPPGSSLLFDVELVDVVPQGNPPDS